MAKSALDVCQRNELWSLIKKISIHYGGDDEQWLKDFGRDVWTNNKPEVAIACFRDLAEQCKWIKAIGSK